MSECDYCGYEHVESREALACEERQRLDAEERDDDGRIARKEHAARDFFARQEMERRRD